MIQVISDLSSFVRWKPYKAYVVNPVPHHQHVRFKIALLFSFKNTVANIQVAFTKL